MAYDDLIEILLSNNVYNSLKKNENELLNLIEELKDCYGFNQNTKWHIYDVYEHILHVIDGVENNLCLRLAALFHDIGKPLVYSEDEFGVGHFYNHWNESVKIFKKYQENFRLSNEEIELIINLIFYHDVKMEKINNKDKIKIIDRIGFENLWMLFSLKRSDLLAQAPQYHNLINEINKQEQSMSRIKK